MFLTTLILFTMLTMYTGLILLKILTMLGIGKESPKTSNKVEESLVMEISFPEVSGWRHSLGTSIMGRRQEIWFTFTLSTKLCFWCVVREALATSTGQIRSKSTEGIETRNETWNHSVWLKKNWQRDNGPEGWVLSPKSLRLSNIKTYLIFVTVATDMSVKFFWPV